MTSRIINHPIAATDAPKGKGGEAVARAARIQDVTMLNVVEAPPASKPKALAKRQFHSISDTRAAALWLDELIAKAGSKVTAIELELTPALAEVLLERNPQNRKIKQGKVDDFASDIEHGSWRLNGEPIIVSADGLLNDGQHRCAAVVKCKTAIKTLLVLGVDRDTRTTLDQGENRKIADYLSMEGYHNTNHLAATAKMLWQYRTYGYMSGSSVMRPTRSEMRQTVHETPGLITSLMAVDRKNARGLASISVLAVCHFLFTQMSKPADVSYFFDALIDGASLERGDPILNARNRLMTDGKRMKPHEKVELLVRAWNAHRLGHTRVLFRITGGELPLIES